MCCSTTQSDLDSAKEVTKSMRNNGTAVWGIAFGSGAPVLQLTDLTGGTNCVFIGPNGIGSQDAIVDWIKKQSCL